MKNIIKPIILVVSLSAINLSCERYLDITPMDKVIPQSVEDFRAMLTRAYQLYPEHKPYINLKSDEVQAKSATEYLKAIFTWDETNASSGSTEIPYATFYQTIFHANYILQNAPKYAPAGAEINQVLGEARALRAYAYFELINIYAPAYNGNNGNATAVPIVSEITLEGDFPKATLNEVYSLILSDINEAGKLINQSSFPVGYNYRFTTTALQAFKARVHQSRGEWTAALEAANLALQGNSKLEDFNNFSILPNHFKSVESIMNLDRTMNSSSYGFARASEEHINLYDQANDLRFAQYFQADGNLWRSKKYSTNNDLKTSFRVAELLLTKAEAEYKSNQEANSKTTLLTLAKTRYNAQGYSDFEAKINGLSGENYYQELLNERARELSFEGLRWYDLRRTTQPKIIHKFDGRDYTLEQGDARYTVPFPRDARLKNPQL